jgi:hypothetical protein
MLWFGTGDVKCKKVVSAPEEVETLSGREKSMIIGTQYVVGTSLSIFILTYFMVTITP